MPDVTIYTDGAARGNPNGPGGYGAVVRYTDASGKVFEREYSAGFAVTTNNRMELMAAIVALENLKVPCNVTLYSDSKYLVDAYNEGWVWYWREHGYRNKQGDAVKNTELWMRLLAQTDRHEVTFEWVKGHNGHPENERCDELATTAADGDTLYVDDGGDLRDPVLYTEKQGGAKSASDGNGAAGAGADFSDYKPGTLSKEALFEKIEALRNRIDEEMELLERMEEEYYSQDEE
ncbi:MAG: ribonuclease HI [Lachnospiraceae bacterium]|nr:ribonuclease HI [Lachnospiraceae bacterium]